MYVSNDGSEQAPTFTVASLQVKAIKAEHGKKAFGQVIVDQVYGCVTVILTRDRRSLVAHTRYTM